MFHDRATTDFAMQQNALSGSGVSGLAARTIRWIGENFDAPLVSAGDASGSFASYADFLEGNELAGLLFAQPDLPSGTDARTCAAFFIGRYAYFLALPLAALHLRDGLTADIDSRSLAVGFEQVVLDHGDHSHELVVPHLRFTGAFSYCTEIGVLREAIENHLEPLIDRLKAETRLSPGAQWRLAGDSIAFAFMGIGEKLGRSDAARDATTALLKHPASPLTNPQMHFVSIPVPGLAEPKSCVARGGCCRYYKVEGGTVCANCVLETEEDRHTRLTELVAARMDKEA